MNKITKSLDKNTNKDLEQVCPEQAHDFLSWLLLSQTNLPRLILSSWSVIRLVSSISQLRISKKKGLNRVKRFIFLNIINTFHITNLTTLSATLSSNQTFLPYVQHNEVWSCVWMGNSSKSNFLHQRDLELWDSRDLPNFPPPYPTKCQESSIFSFLLQCIYPLQI